MFVSVVRLFLTVPVVDLQCVIVVILITLTTFFTLCVALTNRVTAGYAP